MSRSIIALLITTVSGRLIASIDQGTTSTRVILFDEKAKNVASHQMEHEQIYPKDGWCEHDPMTIVENTKTCLDKAVEKLEESGGKAEDVVGIGITNQRETTIVWDKETGKPLHNAVVWLDLRTAELADELKAKYGGQDYFRETCGLPISTYFSAVKLLWLMRNVPAVAEAIANDKAMFGTIDTWLIWNLSGGVDGGVHVTDVTNAGRTMLMDLATCKWHEGTCSELGIPMSVLPAIKSCSEVYAKVVGTKLAGVPIAGCAGDQHAAMLGQACLQPGMAKSTYGTGCFMLMNVGEQPVPSTNGLLSTILFQLGPDAPVTYALEGSVAIAGRAVQFLRDNLQLITSAKEVEPLAREVESTEGVTFVPAFSGLFAPYWRSDARGCIVGMTLYTTKAHLCRATLEAVALQAREVLDAMEADSGVKLSALQVDGGMTVNELLMQMQADFIQTPVRRPVDVETTAMGAAFAAGLAVGVWSSTDELTGLNPPDVSFDPAIGKDECDAKLVKWQDAIKRTFDLA